MNNFAFHRATGVADAVHLLGETAGTPGGSSFLAGGTNLVDLMREGIQQPQMLVDISQLPLTEITEQANGALRVGALVRNSHMAEDAVLRARYPVLSQAILMGASAQLRNMATTGGNLLQRTRCYYFYDAAARCNKRNPGAGCDAIAGFNRIHAILGTSPQCIATHPSDMCVALTALDARVNVTGSGGDRTMPFSEFHRLPGDTPQTDTNLLPGELITSVDVPAFPAARNSVYRKVRDRASYAFAIVSVAAVLESKDSVIETVRIALGGVAHKPWRAAAAEKMLVGKPATEENFRNAAAAELAEAIPQSGNGFKIERTIADALTELAGRQGEAQ